MAAPHIPDVLQVFRSVGLVHWLAPGAHVPVQAPFMHAWPAQGVPMFCQAPLGPHSRGCWPLHPSDPATHATHAAFTHTGVAPEQTAPWLTHVPLVLQNWGVWPLHWLAPGVQDLPASPPPESVRGTPVSPIPPPSSGWPLSMPSNAPQPTKGQARKHTAQAKRRKEPWAMGLRVPRSPSQRRARPAPARLEPRAP